MTDVDLEDRKRARKLLGARTWRLNNLYRIQDKDGNDVRFRMNPVQAAVDQALHNRNVVLKSRQHGITTWACIRALDTTLFRSNTNSGIIAHTKEDADKFFRGKIRFAYDRLPEWLRELRPIDRWDGNGEMVLGNMSRIVVGVSLRSGTYQRLHVSELGKMDETDPQRANEVVSGALNTVPVGGIATVESTARVAHGQFYGMCQRAMRYQRLIEAGAIERLTPLDYKLFFLPWFDDPTNEMVEQIDLTAENLDYFARIEAETGATLRPPQRYWYAKKAEEQTDQMYLEFPSTPEEAFWVSSEGAYFSKLIARAEQQGRITNIPFIPGIPVNTFWDLGRNDCNAIWFHQQVGVWHHFIDYYENSGEGAPFYAGILQKRAADLGYVYGTHYLPHDADVVDYTRGDHKTRGQVLQDLGVQPLVVVPRIENKLDAIEMVRQALPRCRFDRVRCGELEPGSGRGGIPALRQYRKAWNEKAQVWSTKPYHDWSSNGADAFCQFAQGYEQALTAQVRQQIDPRREQRAPSNRWMTA